MWVYDNEVMCKRGEKERHIYEVEWGKNNKKLKYMVYIRHHILCWKRWMDKYCTLSKRDRERCLSRGRRRKNDKVIIREEGCERGRKREMKILSVIYGDFYVATHPARLCWFTGFTRMRIVFWRICGFIERWSNIKRWHPHTRVRFCFARSEANVKESQTITEARSTV